MDRHEAYRLLGERLATLRERPLAELAEFVGRTATERVATASGEELLVEVSAEWVAEEGGRLLLTARADSPSTYRMERLEERVTVGPSGVEGRVGSWVKVSPLIETLDRVIPGFRCYVTSPGNPFRSNGPHAVFAAFTTYVRDRSLEPERWRAVAAMVNEAVESSDEELSNAACTCFLENLAAPDHPLATRLRGDALAYWTRWCERA